MPLHSTPCQVAAQPCSSGKRVCILAMKNFSVRICHSIGEDDPCLGALAESGSNSRSVSPVFAQALVILLTISGQQKDGKSDHSLPQAFGFQGFVQALAAWGWSMEGSLHQGTPAQVEDRLVGQVRASCSNRNLAHANTEDGVEGSDRRVAYPLFLSLAFSCAGHRRTMTRPAAP